MPETNSKNASHPVRLLVVDDDDSFRTVVGEVLEAPPGYEVTLCESGEKAIEALRQKKFDVVILDYKMPGVSGLNVLQWMHEQKMETPVIMLTAAGSETVAVEAMKLGAYDYIRKENIEIDHLPIVINGVYERYLFRKEKERREMEEREKEKNVASLKMFNETVSSIGHFVNTGLSVLSLNVQEFERLLVPMAAKEHREEFAQGFQDIKQEIKVITSGVKSLLSLSSLAYQRFAGAKDTQRLEDTLTKDIETLEAEASKLQSQ